MKEKPTIFSEEQYKTMISCFLQHQETRKLNGKKIIIILICIMFVQFSTNKDVTHYTQSTNCQINFQREESKDQTEPTRDDTLKFKKCIRKMCQSYQLNGLCRSEQQYNLEEWKCYQQCCGSTQFDFFSCSDFNKVDQIKKKNSINAIIAGLSISITGLLIAAIIFAVKYIKCCPKKQQGEKNQSNDADTQKNYVLPSWKLCQFKNQYECFQCKELGAFAMLPCGKLFHIKCLNQTQWACSHCCTPITKIKLYCIVCLKYSIMLKVEKADVVLQRMMEAYSWHPHRCYQYLENELEMDTDRKLTEATNVSP